MARSQSDRAFVGRDARRVSRRVCVHDDTARYLDDRHRALQFVFVKRTS